METDAEQVPGVSPEPPILRARAQGEVSCDASFERLYALYAPSVAAWLHLRAEPSAVDDLFQDVWTIFYGRWRRWQFVPEMEAPGARPVLSFLYRTCHLILRGHARRRAGQPQDSIEGTEVSDPSGGPEKLQRQIELGRCLDLARRCCPPEELDVLLAKLAGLRAREIARSLETTEAAVDHRFRSAVARLQRKLRRGKRDA